MSGVDSLLPRNSQIARSVGVNAFKKFLGRENVPLEYVFSCLGNETSGGSALTQLMDKFAMHLVFETTSTSKNKLARNTVMSYFRQVKNWLLDLYPQNRVLIEPRLLKIGRIIDKFCLKREEGGLVKKVIACTKNDLGKI